ncbi:MAG: Hsp33 family molecular chaperone [Pseudomonadota bacterium]
MTGTDDLVLPFQIEGSPVRGRIVRLGASIDTILTRHAYAPPVSRLVGELTALTAMLGAGLKFDGKLIVQTSGEGPLSMAVADYSTDGALRAYAGVRQGREADASNAANAGALIGGGHLAMTVDQGPHMDRYQGVTPLDGDTVEDWALGYFSQSEQIPTAVKLAVGRVVSPGGEERWRAGGVLAQLMPEEGGERGVASGGDADAEEAWRRAETLLATTQDDELLDPTLAPEALLYRLFHEDGVRVFDARGVRFACGCSRAKIKRVLSQFSDEELEDMAEAGEIRVSCEFCNEAYLFDPATLIKARSDA